MSFSGKSICIIAAFLFIPVVTGCSNNGNKSESGSKPVARINDFALSLEEFQKKLVREMEYASEYKTTAEAKKAFLNSLIEKELFFQEARKRGIDRQPAFVDSIEQYWEATLIKHLMEEKADEIKKAASVSEKEIKKYYSGLKAEKKNMPPLEQVEKQSAQELFEMKKTTLLNEWMASLHKKAAIEIDETFLIE